MMRGAIWVLTALAVSVLWTGACGPRPDDEQPGDADLAPRVESEMDVATVSRHGWQEIRLEATYDVESGVVEFLDPDQVHDAGVHGPGDALRWYLRCQNCEPGATQWRITEYRPVADLNHLTDTVMRVFSQGTVPDQLSLEDLGIREEWRQVAEADSGRAKVPEDRQDSAEAPAFLSAREAYVLEEPGWTEWMPWDPEVPIVATSSRPPGLDQGDELWKYSVEIRIDGWEEMSAEAKEGLTEDQRCQLNPKRACLDPHNYNHPAY